VSGECILVVDDSSEIREVVSEYILRPAGYTVTLAEDGVTGLRLAREQKPDLIIADLQMPGLTGLELKRALAAEGNATPLILITAERNEQIAAEAVMSGAAAYLPKPLDPDVMLTAVEQALETHRAKREHASMLDSLQKRVRELETLQTVSRTLTSSLDLDHVLSRVVEAAVTLTGAEEGTLLLLDEATGELTMRAARNFDDQFVRTFRLRSDDSLAGQVIRTGQPVILGADAPKKIKTAYLVQSLIYVPLRLPQPNSEADHPQTAVIGVLGVDNRLRGRAFDESDLGPLTMLADYAALAIHNARLYAHTETERAKLDAVVNKTDDGVIVADESNRLLLVNAAARAALGLGNADLANRTVLEVITHHDLSDLFSRPLVTAASRRAEITLENGLVFNAHITPIPGVGRTVVLQDITHLKQLDRIKSEFVTTVSHDLRSPLTTIMGYAELLGRVGPLNDQQQDFAARIAISANTIAGLITDLLDLGRIEAGFDSHMELINLPSVVRRAAESLSASAEAKEQKLIRYLPEQLPPVLANPHRIRQLVANLIGNAIKYTPTGGTITVVVQEAEGQQIITVADNGLGIPLADQPYVFDKFYRSKSLPEDIEGTGLGLSIVKSIVESHNGRIWLDSKPGHGTTFTVVLPNHDPGKAAALGRS
jgi:two-component system NtrC family sensor kinase